MRSGCGPGSLASAPRPRRRDRQLLAQRRAMGHMPLPGAQPMPTGQAPRRLNNHQLKLVG